MAQTEADTADQPRYLHGASRAVAYLMLTAAPYVLATGAILPDDADTVEALRAASDAALYGAKMSGRGRIASARSAPVHVA